MLLLSTAFNMHAISIRTVHVARDISLELNATVATVPVCQDYFDGALCSKVWASRSLPLVTADAHPDRWRRIA